MPNIRHEVLIGAPAEEVYDAITSQQGLAGWWTPDTKARTERDSIARFAFGPDYFKEMKVTELTASEEVKWICIAGADEWRGTTISFKLQPGDRQALLSSHPEAKDQIQQQGNLDKGTLLILSHDNWREYTPMFAECNYTWGQFLRSLKLLCETGKGRPWPQQHRREP
jgi:uncharacterized protein YndB with AHSA1/START domain